MCNMQERAEKMPGLKVAKVYVVLAKTLEYEQS